MKAYLRIFDPLSTDHQPDEYWHHGGSFKTVKVYDDVEEVVLTAQGLSIDGKTEAIRYTDKRVGSVAADMPDVLYETLDDEIIFNCVEIAE